jgi:glycerol-3-phosphate dehydrogenase
VNRHDSLQDLRARDEPWDMVIIGGGATGVGTAVDAASRGYSVLLLEQSDFGKGTSSRSTKLVHGGVRYLQKGNVSLVMGALKERGILRRNAPHLVHDLMFIVPNYDWWEAPFYGIGMKVYDMLAGRYGFGTSKLLSREETIAHLPTIETDGLRGGVKYYDGQFDDARLLINLLTTAVEQGAIALNYVQVTGLSKAADGFVHGVMARDMETGEAFDIAAGSVINATGPFADDVRRMSDSNAKAIVVPSQGTHIMLPGAFLPGDAAIMVPRTSDGRVLFVIPWNGCALVGTTDTPIDTPTLEPRPTDEEIDFILETAAVYLGKNPTRADVLSVFTGIRPLVRETREAREDVADVDTSALSRDHTIHIDRAGLLTITGGKWTTYRKMAEDAVDHAATLARLEDRPCVTGDLNIHGYHQHADRFGRLEHYGSDAPAIEDLIQSDPRYAELVHPELPCRRGEVIWAVREEAARTVDDFLARRTRCLLLNARAAMAAAPLVAELMASELSRDQDWREAQVRDFRAMAAGYVPT